MKTKIIKDYLNKLIPDARCELNYSKDYELLIATMLSAQTTDKKVNMVTEKLFKEYNTIEKLALANIDDVKKIIRPIGTYNKKAKNIISIATKIKEHGCMPNDREFLENLDGVGRKTTNVVLSNIYNEPLIAVDTHVSRVSKRLGLASETDSPDQIEVKLNKKFAKKDLVRLHHQLVLFGRYYCKAQSPLCEPCELKTICKYYKKTTK